MSTDILPSAIEAHQQVETFAQTAPQEMRVIPDGVMTPGKWIRQGDIYLVAIPDIGLAFDEPTTNRQLAPGETRGSRHVVEGNVKIFNRKNQSDVLVGSQIDAPERFKVVHPEHAHFELPAGKYQVYFQMDARQAERTRSWD